MSTISDVTGFETVESRGNPTIAARVRRFDRRFRTRRVSLSNLHRQWGSDACLKR